jgi:hypothetical protein
LFIWTIVIDSQTIFLNFFILDNIYEPIRIVHLNSVSIHV